LTKVNFLIYSWYSFINFTCGLFPSDIFFNDYEYKALKTFFGKSLFVVTTNLKSELSFLYSHHQLNLSALSKLNADSFISGNHKVVRNINRSAILNLVLERQPVSRVALSTLSNLNKEYGFKHCTLKLAN